MSSGSGFSAADWAVVGLYFLVLVASGVWINRRPPDTTDGYFRGGGRIPWWAAGVSVVATSLSAASFIGVPQQSYLGDLTYISINIGMVIASVVIAVLFIPAFYAAKVQSIYQYLSIRMGAGAGTASSVMFLAGRVMASGARVYIGAIPASLILFGDLAPGHLAAAIGVLAFVGIVYTLFGGVTGVIWSDVIQMVVLVGACIGAVVLVLGRLEASPGEIVSALSTGGPDGGSKLTVLDATLDPRVTFSLPAAVIGFAIMGIGSYGVDQDLVQRMLTCRDAKAGARSVIGGVLLGVPTILLFLIVGLLLYLFYQHPELVGGTLAEPPQDTRRVFVEFIVEEMPPGLTGLMIAGLFAAGLSSLNSAVNAMSSSFVNDFYRKMRPEVPEERLVKVGRAAVVVWGLILAGFACACIWLERAHAAQGEQGTLLTFALTVMTFAYAGLIGVFGAALLTRRGNADSAIAALVTGFVAVALMQPMLWALVVDLDARRAASPGDPLLYVLDLSFVWKLTIGVVLSFGVCVLGRSPAPAAAAGPPTSA